MDTLGAGWRAAASALVALTALNNGQPALAYCDTAQELHCAAARLE